jgi:hypothetical protein
MTMERGGGAHLGNLLRRNMKNCEMTHGVVVNRQRTNPQEVWLRTDKDIVLAYVCAWPGPKAPDPDEQ